MAKASELEQWIESMKQEATRESSGRFTVDVGSRLERYQKLLELNPSLPWLRATQWAHTRRATTITFQVLRQGLEWRAEGVGSVDDWERCLRGESSTENDPMAQMLLLLQASGDSQLSLSWGAGSEGKDSWHFDGTSLRSSPGEAPGLSISLQLSKPLPPRERLRFLREFRQRTHFASIPIVLDGRSHDSRLDLTSAATRSFGVSVELADARTTHAYFACAPPSRHQPLMMMCNGRMVSGYNNVGPSGEVLTTACYNLRHPALEQKSPVRQSGADAILLDDDGLGLAGCGEFLGPTRHWSRYQFLGWGLGSRSVLPLNACAVFLLSDCPDRGPVHLIPIRQGVNLTPVTVPGYRTGSVLIAACPDHLASDLSGLRLVENSDFQAWSQTLVEQARRSF